MPRIAFTIFIFLTGSILLLGQRMTMRTYGLEAGFENIELNTLRKGHDGKQYLVYAGYLSIFDGYIVENIKIDTLGFVGYGKDTKFLNTEYPYIVMISDLNDIYIFDIENKRFDFVETKIEITDSFNLFNYGKEAYLFNRNKELARLNIKDRTFYRDSTFIFLENLRNFNKKINGTRTQGENLILFSNNEHLILNPEFEISIDANLYTGVFSLRDKIFVAQYKDHHLCIIQDSTFVPVPVNTHGSNDYWVSLRQAVSSEDEEYLIFGLLDLNNENISYWHTINENLEQSFLGYIPVGKYSPVVNDHFDNLWFATHQGLKKFNPKIQYFQSGKSDIPFNLHAFGEMGNNSIWLAGYHNTIAKYEDGQVTNYKNQPYKILPGFYAEGNGSIYLNYENPKGVMKINPDESDEFLQFTFNNKIIDKSAYYIFESALGELYFGLQGIGIGRVKSISQDKIDLDITGKEKGIDLGNVLCIEEDLSGRIWMGRSSTGIAVYDPKIDTAFTYKLSNNNPASFGAMSMDLDKSGNLWFGTNKGVFYLKEAGSFDISNQDMFEHTVKIDLPNNDHSTVTFLKQIEDYMVFGNNSAVSFIPLEQWYKDPDICPIYQLYYDNDIEGNGSEQNMIFQDSEGYLWWGSQEGASRMDIKNYVFDTTSNEVEIIEIINGRNILELKNDALTLPTDNRNFNMRFGPMNNISLLKNVFFDYFLINENGDTLIQKRFDQEGKLNISYLTPGKFKLEIFAKKHGLTMHQKSVIINVPYGFLEKPAHQILGMSLILSSIIFFLIYRNQQRKRAMQRDLQLAKISQEKNQLQLQSIISSFNPHFINNSLHWAQSRYRNDKELVNVIGSLSENIRYIFTNTRNGNATHSFEEEMKIVENYIQIQRIRFKNSFEFRGPSEELKQRFRSFEMPILQLQIHIENAIEHGLRNRIESSIVEIDLKEDPNYLNFIITDDGVGRNRAAKLNSKGTQTGTSMLTSLHNLFNNNKANKYLITTIYEDEIYTDAEGNRFGTRVIIKIPKQFTYGL